MNFNRIFFALLLCVFISACENSKSTETRSEPSNSDSTNVDKSASKSKIDEETKINVDSTTIEKNTVDTTDISLSTDTIQNSDNDMDKQLFALIPKGIKDANLIDLSLVPSELELGTSSYPGSYLIDMGTPITYNNKMYCTMELVSEDHPEEITEFYKGRKESWLYVQQNNVHTFKQDKDAYFRETNNLQIKPFDESNYPNLDTLLSFEPNSTIFIYYELKSGKHTAMLN